ncbi:trypsin-like peptidase domain-containing protein [Streptomyces sp. MMG1121]|uniref:trypsin-like peptidase domain-containing protein n=1 Tax=Streptomyces sp. MMG1121 TaxID=1415544 RepID=UPI000B1F3BF4|nr:trypsin-like peptidase domain-containing protein [Streptomyces sp. MMG1121]
MAGRGPRTGNGRPEAQDGTGRTSGTPDLHLHPPLPPRPVPALVQIRDLAGRPRGIGFLADHDGTLLTSHEAVDGLPRLVLHAEGDGAGERVCVVDAAAVTPLPARDLALVRTEGLGLAPLPLTVRERIDAGTYVEVPAGCWRQARVLAATEATYTATDRFHLLPDVLELAIGTAGRDALRLGGGAAGGPVLDPRTGAVLGIVGTALHSARRDAGFAVPLRPADGPLAELLARNAATVPAYGADLNPAGIQELTATSLGQDGPHAGLTGIAEPVERAGTARELAAFVAGDRTVLALVGAPGSGRTTELAALAARRARAERPAPTLWLRGADLADADGSLADAARRTLERAARIVAAARRVHPDDLGDLTPEGLARLAARAGHPLLLLLDGPEEMPPVLAHRLPEWIQGTADWLRETGARLVVACREEYWERAGAGFPTDLLYAPAGGAAPGSGAVPAGGGAAQTGAAAPAGRAVPAGSAAVAGPAAPAGRGAAAGPVAEAAPVADAGPGAAAGCAVAAVPAARSTATAPAAPTTRNDPVVPFPPCVRLAALTPDEARRARVRYGIPDDALVGRDAGHPLTLRLLSEVRAAAPDAPFAGPVDRHEVFAAHLDLMCLRIAVRLATESGLRGTAVRRLAARVAGQVHEAARRSLGPGQGELDRESFEAVFPWGPAPARLGGGTGWASAVLTEGLLVPAGTGYRFAHEELADWIQGTHLDLDEALRALVHRPRATWHTAAYAPVPVPHHRVGPVVQALLLLARQHGARQLAFRLRDLTEALDRDPGSWWAARLLAHTLLQVPDATPYTDVLSLLADRVVAWRRARRPVPAEFGPGFWTELPVPDAERIDLLRRLVLADQSPPEPGERYLDAVARLLAAAPAAVQPQLTRWFDDERPLPATPHATVATAAQALLHTHRHGALDDLTDLLAASAHRRADELLTTLAEDEPSAVCRAVDRWAHDGRPARRAAAVAFGPRAAPHARAEADRELLRHAALALLARPADATLHGGALALLVHDPHTRDRYLAEALRHFADGDPHIPPGVLAPALATHPEPVLEAFRARLRAPDAADILCTLSEAATPALARSVAALAREAVRQRPQTAGRLAAHVEDRLEQGPTARPVLLPLVTGLLDDGPEPLRAALATVLAGPATPASRPLRRELLEVLLAREQDPSVLDAVLHAAAEPSDSAEEDDRREEEVRGLVHRTGLLLVRTPEGATRFDRGLVDLGRHVPGFATQMARWLTDTPDDWVAVVGPSTRRMLENLAGVRVPA